MSCSLTFIPRRCVCDVMIEKLSHLHQLQRRHSVFIVPNATAVVVIVVAVIAAAVVAIINRKYMTLVVDERAKIAGR